MDQIKSTLSSLFVLRPHPFFCNCHPSSYCYFNILAEFAASGQAVLRLLPVSGGNFAGSFAAELPALTWEALARGAGQLSPLQRAAVAGAAVHLCLFLEADLPAFEATRAAWDDRAWDAAQEAAELAQVSLGSAWPAGWPGDPTLSLPCFFLNN